MVLSNLIALLLLGQSAVQGYGGAAPEISHPASQRAGALSTVPGGYGGAAGAPQPASAPSNAAPRGY